MTPHLYLSDAPHVDVGQASLVPLAARDAALLAWLAIEGPTTRARLAALLWPAAGEAQARTTLRQRLFQLRRALGTDLVAGTTMLQLADDVRHDLGEATELLGDLQLPDAPELDAWLRGQREQRHSREREALQAQAEALEAAGDRAAALVVAAALLRQQPLTEAAHQRLMRLHYLEGDRAAALAAFDACEHALKHELGTRPSAATLALLATIERSGEAPSTSLRRALPAAVLRPPMLVGRDVELQALHQAWAAGQVAALVGEAGMGKSRLLAELAPPQPGGAWLRVSGRPGDSEVPFALLCRLLRSLGALAPANALAHPAQWALARLLPELAALPGGSEGGQRTPLPQAVAAWLGTVTTLQGVMLDDLHFADAATLDLLHTLLTEADAPPLRWALAFRPAEAAIPLRALQAALTEAARLQAVALAPLDLAALAALVDQLALGLDGETVAPLLLRRTGGNPLFVLETLKAAWLAPGGAPLAALADDSGSALPRALSVERLIDQRIARLSAPALALARVAAIAGVDFSIALAEAVLGTAALHFADALVELEAAQVLRGAQFAHDLVFDAALRSVPPAIAQHSHGQVAAWLAQHGGEPARIARHWIDAGQPAQALPWLTQAAQRAREALRNTEVLAFLDLRSAIEQACGLQQAAFKTLLDALEEHRSLSRDGPAGYARCDALDRMAASPEQRIQAWLARAEFQDAHGDGDLGLALARQALDEAQRIGSTEWIRKSQILLAGALHAHRRLPELLAMSEACLGWINDHPDGALRMSFHASLGHLYSAASLPHKAQQQYEQSYRLAQAHGDQLARSILLSSLASVRGDLGQARHAIEVMQGALQMREQFEARTASAASCLHNLAAIGLQLCRFGDALRWADDAEQRFASAAPNRRPQTWGLQAHCWLRLGQFGRALQRLDLMQNAPSAAPTISGAKEKLVRFQLGRDRGKPDPALLDEALALLVQDAYPRFWEILAIERARTLPPAEALQALEASRQRSAAREAADLVLDSHLYAAEIATPHDPALARGHALRAMALYETADPVCAYLGELWLHCANALLAAGDDDTARQVLTDGLAWLRTTLRDQVPPEFADSFIHRNPVNVALRALADRHGLVIGV